MKRVRIDEFKKAMCKLFCIFVQIYKMHRLILGLLPLFFISISCKKKVPEGILPQDDMVELMTDVHILDGYISNIPVDSAKKVIDPLYEELFAKYGLDSTSFNKNVNYYFGDPKLTVKTYDQVVKSLEKKERNFYSTDSLQNAISQDSIRRVTQLQNNASIMTNMIMNAKADTSELTIAERTRRFYQPVGLMPFWEKNIFEKRGSETIGDSPVPTIQQPNLETVPDTLQPLPNPNELKPLERIDTVPFNPRNQQLKPVRRPRERPAVVQ
jgi:hypothetical protein